MWIERRKKFWGLTASLTALALLPACGADASNSDTMSTSPTSTTAAAQAVTTTTAIAAPVPMQGPRIENWVDLEIGDCLAEIPPVDQGAVTVTIIDCAAAHAAEVFLRAPIAVNAAITDVADRECVAGFPQYTGRSIDGSPFVVTYLIDSNQDRTSGIPTPTTVICLLQAANGQPLTESARG